MAKSVGDLVGCPKCRGTCTVTKWEIIDAELGEDVAQQIISGNLFMKTCPHCGCSFKCDYDTVYNDDRHNMMIWVVSKENYEQKVRKIREMDFPKTKKIRIVHSIERLQEKVALLENGRDDRVVEIMKVAMFSKADKGKRLTRKMIDMTRYYSRDGAEYFGLCDKFDSDTVVAFQTNEYEKTQRGFSVQLAQADLKQVEVVDCDWALMFVEGKEDNRWTASKASFLEKFTRIPIWILIGAVIAVVLIGDLLF